MRILKVVFVVSVFAVLLMACNSKNKSKEIANYEVKVGKVELNSALNAKVGSWIDEGMDCYGIVVINTPEGAIKNAKTVKAKVVFIQPDKIKMRALEEVSVAPKEGCSKMGIMKGDTWWEEEGDLFKTKEEAEQFIKNELKFDASKVEKPDSGKFLVN